ncbi:MAG: hypothetical protein QM627_01850 [Luteolibacter sp.]
MKAIFLALAILAAGGAAVFSYMEGTKISEVIAKRQQSEEETKSLDARIAKADKEIESQKAKITEANNAKELVSQNVSALKSSESSLKREMTTLEEEEKTQESQIAELNKAIEELSGLVSGLGEGITIDNLASKIQEMNDIKKERETKLEETRTLAEAAAKAAATNRAETDRLHKRDQERVANVRFNASESVITAVNVDWGFVVIGAGSNSGFKPQTPLLVERDGRYIGKVIPSSVERTQTIAEIDTSSLSTGVRLQPGDRVIVGKPAN